MQNHKKTMFSIFAVMMLSVAIPVTFAQGDALQYNHSAGIVTLETDNIAVRITGANQAPHFHWWSPLNETTDYHMKFISIFEANDTNADGVFTQDTDTIVGPRFILPTEDWEFEGFIVDSTEGVEEAVHFNFTSTTEYEARPGGPSGNYGALPDLEDFNVTIQIRVHIDLDSPNEIKFDVVVDGWTWTYEDSILVMQFTITESNHGVGQSENEPSNFHKTGTQFDFAAGYMQYEETALAAQNALEVKASYGEGVGAEGGESVYLAFENFGNETLEYDPILGVDSTSNGLPLDTNTLLLIGGSVVVIAILAVVLKSRK